MDRLYMDYNASMPLCDSAKKAMVEALGFVGNASSVHAHGREVRQHIEATREKIATYFGAKASQVIFTSGATEANNLMIRGFNGTVIASAIEHDSILQARSDLVTCPVDGNGIIDVAALDEILMSIEGPKLVSVMAANNETGVIQPLEKIGELARRHGAIFHTDAVQAMGKIPVQWASLGLQAISVSAHKIGGPQGVGALIADEKLPLKAQIAGGGQERSLRSGTENMVGIIGFGAAIESCSPENWQIIESLRDTMEAQLLLDHPEVEIYGHGVPRLPNTSILRMPGAKSNTQVMHFDLKGISLSAGSACSSGKVKPSHVLKAMGVPEEHLGETVRVSFGPQTTFEEIKAFIDTWKDLYSRTNNDLTRRAS